MKCYRCGQSGHKAHDCTNEAKVRCPQSPAALAPPTPRSPPLPCRGPQPAVAHGLAQILVWFGPIPPHLPFTSGIRGPGVEPS